MLGTHYVVFETKIMFSNIILPTLSFCVTKVPDFASIESLQHIDTGTLGLGAMT